MFVKDNFFHKRRSVMANKMDSSPIEKKDVDSILAAGIRVPDHGALSPWKLIAIQGESLAQIDNEILLPEFKKTNSNADEEIIEAQTKRFQRAGLVIAVLSTPVKQFTLNTFYSMNVTSVLFKGKNRCLFWVFLGWLVV